MEKFEFSDPRQKRIHRRLLLIGHGPASFYIDACKLMADEYLLSATTHVVGHLLREIESALRNVLKTVADGPESKLSGNQKHRETILSILRGLNIGEDAQVAKAWLQLPGQNNEYGLAARAHRDNLGSPRPVDPEFRNFWQEMESILDVILERFEARYLECIRFLDELIAKPLPTSDDVDKLRKNVPNNLVTLGYFFDNLESSAWLKPLLDDGFFKHPPELVRDEETQSVTFPQWPESRYLARIAGKAPGTVCDIILQVDRKSVV